MDFARPIMWNVPHAAEIALYAMIPLVVIAFAAGVLWRLRKWSLGRSEPGAETIVQRLKHVFDMGRLVEWLKNALFQWRLARDPFATFMHLAIFWGMAVLFLGTALATIDQDFTNLPFDFQVLRGNVYRLFELGLDLFGVVLLVGIGLAAWRRYVQRPDRLAAPKRPVSKWDSFPFLSFLFVIAVTGFVAEGLRLAEGFRMEDELLAARAAGPDQEPKLLDQWAAEGWRHLGKERQQAEMARIAAGGRVFPAAAWAPVGYGLARLFEPMSIESMRSLHRTIWWGHALVAFGFIVAIPFTKAFHLVSSPLNMFFRSPAPVGRLPVTAESGVATVRDFTWRQLMQMDSCTWCGKCQEACPGYNSGFPLSPRDVVQAIDGEMVRTAIGRAKNGSGNGKTADEKGLHDLIPAKGLWSCCTCRACEDVCPVQVEHPRAIIDMRRRLVDQGQVDEGLQDALMNFQRYGNSFGQSPRKRAEWIKKAGAPLKDARKEEVEYLWFFGDYAAYDQRALEATQATARVFERAGLDVGVLMEKEQNAGNDVRRVGEEGLFDLLKEKNVQALGAARFRQVVTTDPHTYNTLKNEYAGADGNGGELAEKPVLHYAELLDRLIAEGKLKIEKPLGRTVTYHDPCYLGRYNGVYEAPRRVLAALGVKLVEMPRNRQSSFCCGAGGGRIWMKDTPGIEERPAENRVKEALALPGVECLVVACPKDLVMFQDAVKTVGAEGRLEVVDLGQLVDRALGTEPEVST